ncbi:hypothetical protein K0U27_10480 [archaeon]|nr:hypothetical protein [archaeon]
MNRLKIIIKNNESIKIYHDASDVSVLPKSKLVRTFTDDGSLIEEFKLLDKKIAFDDNMDNDETEIIVTLDIQK